MLVISLMTSTVGVCSVYFHATLSMMGQLLDEMSILWSLMTGVALWLPEYHFPRFCKGKRYVTVRIFDFSSKIQKWQNW